MRGPWEIASQHWPWRWKADIADNEHPLALTVLPLYCTLSSLFLRVISRQKERGKANTMKVRIHFYAGGEFE